MMPQSSSYPRHGIARLLQAQGYDGRPVKYHGMVDVLQKAFRHEGVRGLYKVGGNCPGLVLQGTTAGADSQLCGQGILPNLAKVAPAAGISWFVFEEVKLFLGVNPQT